MTADELWEKYARNGLTEIGKVDFLDALTEYGEHVRAEAVSVCRDEENGHVMSKYAKVSDCQIARQSAHNCAAAIEKMPLP